MKTFAECKAEPEAKFVKKTELVKKEQTGFIIKTDEDYQVAKDRLSEVTALEKEINATFDPIVKKAHETHKEATTQRKKFLDPAQAAKRFYQRLIGDYDYEKEQARRKEEKLLNDERIKAAEKKQLAQAEKLEKSGFIEEADAVLETQVEVIPVHIEPEEKDTDVKFRDNWKAEVDDESKIPREYLIVDMSKLDKMAKVVKGDSTIPGVRFVNRRIAISK